jgi:regulator of replication initiation timing
LSQPVDYSRRVQAETEGYIRELLDQTQRLRTLASSLQAEKESLQEELSSLRVELDKRKEEEETLQHQIAEIARANQESLDRYQEVVMQNASISNLYVATYRLHGTVDRESVLLAIQEVSANLIGCEELAVFVPDAAGELLVPLPAVAFDREAPGPVPIGEGPIGTAAGSLEIFLSESPGTTQSDAAGDVSACVPLHVGGRLLGVVAFYRLLPQKFDGFTDLDLELMRLIATHGSMAFYCTQLREQSAQREAS